MLRELISAKIVANFEYLSIPCEFLAFHDYIIITLSIQFSISMTRRELRFSTLGTITEKSPVAFSLGGDNLKRFFDQR